MKDYAKFMMAQHEAMADVEERIAAFKNRLAEQQLAAYDASCRQYEAEGAEVYSSAIASGMSEMEAIGHMLRSGYGPRIYNPPVSAMVRYVVYR